MKDNHSFEDNIKKKMEEFNDVPSSKIGDKLNQMELSHFHKTKNSIIMKWTIISLSTLSILAFSFWGYNFIKGNDLTEIASDNNSPSIERILSIQEQAKKEDKDILIKVSMEGCTFCGKMENNTILLPEVQKAINDNFIILDLDIKDPKYKEFFDAYKINGVPAFIFIGNDGKYLDKVIGFKEKEPYLEVLEYALEKALEENDVHDHHNDNGHGHGHGLGNYPLDEVIDQMKKDINSFKEKRKVYNTETKQSYSVDEDEIKKIEESNSKFLEEKGDLNLKVFPNPNDGNFTVSLEGCEEETILNFMNSQGGYLLGEKIEGGSYARTLEYNMGDNPGVILLRAEQGKNVATEKIIIQK